MNHRIHTALLTAAACLGVGLVPQPAHATGPGAWVVLQNAYTRACLGINTAIAGPKPVSQVACRPTNDNSWHLSKDGWLRNGYQSDSCLDTNGTRLYLSVCNTTDPGQLWERIPGTTVGVVSRGFPGRALVGWATGTVGLAAPGTVDDPAKYQWKWNWQ
ncbi:ricin-type beta-trefoil lectin domain protein [Streptomyces yaizuensis]|uniref:Ricin-type beta-trefoil lectin domain protein n=1 Tax=Streptomyces yaizuensis TaxID=2989713 RepID=A0ABQ5NQG3_9ACTN|nr:ricin-type beta-trefoil lectin domain protein [Streptomyces sp. YSPA8]GLF92622.1 ricin-type beta-trefoil lectin domain protein [Streptomyces sp. YSPA8]